jgi:hypothetical protein
MTANAGYKTFNTGDVLTAAQVQYNLQNQTVMYFATTTARDAALTGSILVEGMVSYVPSTGIRYYNGSAWVAPGTASPLTTKGDVWGYSTTDARIPVGSNNQVLTADSTQALGVKWATPVTGSMTLLSTTTLSGTATTISGIDQTYTNLVIFTENPYVNATAALQIKPNGSTGLSQVMSITSSSATANVSEISTGGSSLPTTTQVTASGSYLTINNYADTTYTKPFLHYGTVNTTLGGFVLQWGTINTASAISSIQITTAAGTSTFSGGRVLIYGVK